MMNTTTTGRDVLLPTLPLLLGLACLSLTGCVALTDFDGYSADDAGADATADGDVDAGDDADADAGGPDGGADAAADGAVADGAMDGSPGDGSTPDGGPRLCDPTCPDGESCVDGTCHCGSGATCSSGSCCDGACVDTDTDVSMCGGCGRVCPSLLNSIASCEVGSCEQRCEDSFQDCEGDTPGCETPLLDAEHCGRCGNPCAAGAFCSDSGGTISCVAACSGALTECAGACVDTNTDLSHCSGCGASCAFLPQTTRTCAGGACGYACTGDFVDCNRDLSDPGTSDGCEVVPSVYYADGDDDGVGAGSGTASCPLEAPAGWVTTTGDCDDSNADRYPGNPELCNGVDDNCVGGIDEGYTGAGGEALGSVCRCEAGSAAALVTCLSTTSSGCDYPAEVCNGLDDDCDGAPDNGFACTVGETQTCTFVGPACSITGTRTCDGSCGWGTCQPPTEACGGGDDNCNGFVDEGTLRSLATRSLVATTSGTLTVFSVAWNPTAREYGVFFGQEITETNRQWLFVRLGEDGAPISTPSVVRRPSVNPDDSAIGWDGSEWVLLGVEDGVLQQVRLSATGAVVSDMVFPEPEAASSVNHVSVAAGNVDMLVMWTRFTSSVDKDTWAARLSSGSVNASGQVAPSGAMLTTRPSAFTTGSGVYHIFAPRYQVDPMLGDIVTRRMATGGSLSALTTMDPSTGADVNVTTGHDPASGNTLLTYDTLSVGPAGGSYDAATRSFAPDSRIDNNGRIALDGRGNFTQDGSSNRLRASDLAPLPEAIPDAIRRDHVSSPGGMYELVRIFFDSGVIFFEPLGC